MHHVIDVASGSAGRRALGPPRAREAPVRERHATVSGSTAGSGLDVGRLEPPAALGAGQLGEHDVAAGAVAELDGRARAAAHPAIAPAQDRDDDGVQVTALLGEAVLAAV